MEQRWGFLAPWCAALKEHIRYGPLDLADPHKSRLLVTLPYHYVFEYGQARDMTKEAFDSKMQTFREALALLGTVAHVDNTAWRFLLAKYCELPVAAEADDKDVAARFLLQISPSDIEHSKLIQLCGSAQLQRSPEYVDSLEKIAALGSINGPTTEICVPVQVLVVDKYPIHIEDLLEGDMDEEEVTEYVGKERHTTVQSLIYMLDGIPIALKTIQEQCKKAVKDRQDGISGSLQCYLVLEPMSAVLDGYSMTPPVMEKMKIFLSEDVSFSYLYLSVAVLQELIQYKSSMITFGSLLARIFDTTQHPLRIPTNSLLTLQQTCTRFQIDHVHLDCCYNDFAIVELPAFTAICSALVTNQTTRRLSMNLCVDYSSKAKNGEWWKWLAYGMFSKRARERSSLESISLLNIMRLSIPDVKSFSSILEADHPEEELCRRPHGQICERDAMLAARAPVRWTFDPRTDEPDSDKLTVETEISVRTFSDDGSSVWVDAMVPGFGRCQVQRKDLTFDESSTANGGHSRLLSLTLQFNDDGKRCRGLPGFLKAVGSSLRFLTLSPPEDGINVDLLLQNCPNLEELILCGNMVRLQFSCHAINTTSQPLPSLKLKLCDASGVLKVLGSSNPLVQCVHRLRLNLDAIGLGVGEWHEIDNWLSVLLQMLKTNQYLEDVEVVISHRYKTSPNYATYRREFSALVPTSHMEKLSRETKIAFLSVLSSGRASAETGKRRKLAGELLGTVALQLSQNNVCEIFAFAGLPILRRITFRSSWRWFR